MRKINVGYVFLSILTGNIDRVAFFFQICGLHYSRLSAAPKDSFSCFRKRSAIGVKV